MLSAYSPWSLSLLFVVVSGAAINDQNLHNIPVSTGKNETTSASRTSMSSSNDATSASLSATSARATSTGTSSGPKKPSAGKNVKRGLAFAAGDTPDDILNANQTDSVISWVYDWANTAPDYLATSGLQYYPMQWGSGEISEFADAVKASGAKTVLGYNEPDFDKESNISPSEAAALWKQYIEPLKESGIRLGAPAVTAAGTGRPWLVQFLAACDGCTIDFIPFHWYGTGTEGFYAYLYELHAQFPDKPLWVTEYADTSPNEADVLNFMNTTTTLMDGLDWVERYAWFGFFRPRSGAVYNLLDEMGGLNALGQFYVGAETIHTSKRPTAVSGYTTVNGADMPSQVRVSVFPAATNGALSAWSVLGSNTMSQTFGILATLLGCSLGALWTLI